MDIHSLADFRRWATSDEFPERGRIDYIAGRIEVDMSPETFFSHGGLKVEICGMLLQLVKRLDLGYLRTDCTRISSVPADLSAEPDVVFISHESLAEGRVQLISQAGAEGEEYIEVEGGPDLVVEVVSRSSARKDTKRLPGAYFNAGVREFWLADARREPFVFRIHNRGESEFEAVAVDADGFQPSAVLNRRFRLDSHRDRAGHWAFDLREKPV
jgi:Uma2 family endonuclease